MDSKEWTFIDKSTWPERGVWDHEPDKAQWADAATGLPCLAVRNTLGAWCGYVGVAEGHPAYGQEYGSINVEVHGGATFAARCAGDPEGHAICHVPGPGEPEHLWWIGFDCAHAWDLLPPTTQAMHAIRLQYPIPGEEYRTLAYVKAETARLAEQLAAMAA